MWPNARSAHNVCIRRPSRCFLGVLSRLSVFFPADNELIHLPGLEYPDEEEEKKLLDKSGEVAPGMEEALLTPNLTKKH